MAKRLAAVRGDYVSKAAPKSPAKAAERFTGFTPALDHFFADLAENMNREWFIANKPRFERSARVPLNRLLTALTLALAVRDIPLTGDPKTSIFRINRDIRFSNDKSPYKLNVSCALTRDGSKQAQGLLYIQVGLGGTFIAAGFYGPAPEQLAAFRDEIADHPKRWSETCAILAAAGLDLSRADTLARLPRGFDADRAGDHADDIRLKSFVVRREITSARRDSPDLVVDISDFAAAALPLLRFGWSALTRVAAPTHLRGPSRR